MIPEPAGPADQIVSVGLKRWQWIYFLGWLEAKRDPAETHQITDITVAIAGAAAP